MATNNAINVPSSTIFTKITLQIITVTGTYTRPSNLIYARIITVGSGGGGGGSASGSNGGASGGGGGSGGYAESILDAASIGASQSVTIGASGAGGTAGNNNGSNGGTTLFGALLSATGGIGGSGMGFHTDCAAVAGGLAGTGSGGNVINTKGEDGKYGFLTAASVTAIFIPGYGGSILPFGAGGGYNGSTGSGYGAGGSGGAAANSNGSVLAQAGAAGTAGVIIVYEYCY